MGALRTETTSCRPRAVFQIQHYSEIQLIIGRGSVFVQIDWEQIVYQVDRWDTNKGAALTGPRDVGGGRGREGALWALGQFPLQGAQENLWIWGVETKTTMLT